QHAGAGEGESAAAAFCSRWRKNEFNWSPSWVPQGFSEVSSSRRPLPTMDNLPIESRLYLTVCLAFPSCEPATQNAAIRCCA
ncbi:anti-sigma E factor, partial [Salmonella enterica subsp. enterica serovar Enteritidis str. 76-2651]